MPLSKMSTHGLDPSPLEDEIRTILAVIPSNEITVKCSDEPGEVLFDNDEHVEKPGITEVLAISNGDSPLKHEPRSNEEFLELQGKDPFCHQVAQLVEVAGSQISVDEKGLVVQTSRLDGARQLIVLLLLQPRVLYLAHYLVLAADAGSI